MQNTACPSCGSTDKVRDYEHGEIYCSKCGCVLDENIIDLDQEWRAYDQTQRNERTRTGPPSTWRMPDKGLCTQSVDNQITRLKKHLPKDNLERVLILALTEIDRMTCALKLPRELKEECALMYRKASEKRIVRGRSIEGVVSTIVFIICKQNSIPRSFHEIAEIAHCNQHEIRRTYLTMIQELNLKIPLSDPILYIPRFCSELGLSKIVESYAIDLLKNGGRKLEYRGLGPLGIAAGAIFKAANDLLETRTKREIAAICGVSEMTIRQRYNDLNMMHKN